MAATLLHEEVIAISQDPRVVRLLWDCDIILVGKSLTINAVRGDGGLGVNSVLSTQNCFQISPHIATLPHEKIPLSGTVASCCTNAKAHCGSSTYYPRVS